MAKRDYYETLGIQRGAGPDEIKKAYRKLAMQHHPDRNAGDASAEQKFKEANEAYDVLKDEQKRAAYDRFGHAAFENGGPGAGGGGAHGFDFATGFADIFDEMFGEFGGAAGGRGGRRRPARGSDLRYNMGITLEDAYQGKQARIRVPTSMACDSCKGTGAEGAAAPVTCNTCDGSGRVRATQGFFTIERTCPNCHGSGQVIEKACKDCGGAGRQQHEKTLDVTIPAGVEDGTRIRLSGEGEAGMRGAPPGDLYIFLNVKPHRIFHREGADIHCRVPIPMTTATLGGSIEVPTVGGGKARVTIPEGAQTGRQFRLKGKGMPVLRSTQHGDMYIEAVVETPVNLSRKQKDLLAEFAKVGSGKRSNSPESEGFFAKVKELWDDLRD